MLSLDPRPFGPKPCPALLTAVFKHYPILVLVVVLATIPCLLIRAIAGTIIQLVDCLYDGFMQEEWSSTPKPKPKPPKNPPQIMPLTFSDLDAKEPNSQLFQ
ncbi:MAG TPA: hypothetical protein VEL11_08795, partial [Candidatus Bathyarchaeia archaeon]|nr:hypothetical protein [Candidatus Bathyarchaeia archaeon]